MGGPSNPDNPRPPPPGDPDPGCPRQVLASLTSPPKGVIDGSRLDVVLDAGSSPPRVLVVEPVDGRTVGSLTGVPDLRRLIACLAKGVSYRALVLLVEGGRIDLRIVRQD